MTDINTLPFYHTVQDLKEKDSLKILGSLETEKYFSTPSEDSINATVKALEAKGVKVHVVDTGAEATALVKGLIPAGASVMNPMSTTVAQIGLLDVIKTNPEWNNLHKAILAETDQAKVGALRRASFNADYWISGVNAITESGDIVTVDGTGTRTGGWTAAKNVIAVTSVQKIVKTLEEAHERVNKFCVPLEATRYNLKFGWPGAAVGTSITFASNRPAFLGGDLHVVLIKKELVGF